jgi:two-component system NtrC family response regulator
MPGSGSGGFRGQDNMQKLLIVEDTEEIRNQMKWGLGKDYSILQAGNYAEAIALLKKNAPKVVTLDLGLPPDAEGTTEGFRCLEGILSCHPATKVIVLTGNEQRENAYKAIQNGAYDFYQKPINLNELKVIINRAFHLSNIEEENSLMQSALEQKNSGLAGIIGQCPRMQQVFSTVKKVASSDVAVFITGESGTGKELFARALHEMSLRKDAPFIPINCGAIPENLLESELFGVEKGAFTGAFTRVAGKIEYAHKGTLFLDEIGELPASLQVKLLRYLQEKVLQRVGGREDIGVDARVISATNLDIAKAIQEGLFREDLYYRIAVITINLPPLRERGEDIMVLAHYFLKRADKEYNKKVRGFSTAAVELLESYEWPGNVRELENRIQRAVILSDSALIEPEALGFTERSMQPRTSLMQGLTLKDARDRVEREMIFSATESHGGNISKAAEVLGISRPTLYDLLKKHGLNNG